MRDYYDPRSGVKRQKSLGRRTAAVDEVLAQFTAGKAAAASRFAAAKEALDRQAAINRALRLGRVPVLGADIIRATDEAQLLRHGMRVVGTYALFAYEAAAGLHLSPDVTTTDDIDILFDARTRIRLALDESFDERTFLGILKRVDTSFARTARPFEAANREGYSVDLITPLRNPPWKDDRRSLTGQESDIEAVEIAELVWHENSPAFESIAIDARGQPVRIVAPDPRAFAVHKHWLSARPDRNPLKRRRDAIQARVVAALVSRHLLHLPFEPGALRSFPRRLVDDAAPLFD